MSPFFRRILVSAPHVFGDFHPRPMPILAKLYFIFTLDRCRFWQNCTSFASLTLGLFPYPQGGLSGISFNPKILEPFGYTVGKNLFGAPYDWRFAPDSGLSSFFQDLKTLVENVTQQTQSKVVLISDSNGPMVVLVGVCCARLADSQQVICAYQTNLRSPTLWLLVGLFVRHAAELERSVSLRQRGHFSGLGRDAGRHLRCQPGHQRRQAATQYRARRQ